MAVYVRHSPEEAREAAQRAIRERFGDATFWTNEHGVTVQGDVLAAVAVEAAWRAMFVKEA